MSERKELIRYALKVILYQEVFWLGLAIFIGLIFMLEKEFVIGVKAMIAMFLLFQPFVLIINRSLIKLIIKGVDENA